MRVQKVGTIDEKEILSGVIDEERVGDRVMGYFRQGLHYGVE